MKTGLLTHFDLDGCLSHYFISKKFKIDEFKAQGYSKIFQNAKKLRDDGVTNLLITDLMLDKETLKWCLIHFDKVTIFDHHQETEKYLPLQQKTNKLTIYFNDKLCGAAVVTSSLNMTLDHRDRSLLKYCNNYDLWKRDSVDNITWLKSIAMNDLFWHYSRECFWGFFDKLETLDMDRLSKKDMGIIKHFRDNRKRIIEESVSDMFPTGSLFTLLADVDAINHVDELIDYGQFERSSNGVFYNVSKVHHDSPYSCAIRIKGKDTNLNAGDFCSSPAWDKSLVKNAGGHAKASGIQFKENVEIDQVIEVMKNFDEIFLQN